jgi:hypothetical protein
MTVERQNHADELLLDFYERFRAIRQGVPDCKLYDFRREQRRRLRWRKIDPTGGTRSADYPPGSPDSLPTPQIRTVESVLAEANRVPSGDHDKHQIN